jgi:S-adenosylmethionine:tRNA ribosyltransferase-isomerase
MMDLIKEKGVLTAGITLHVGPGTFKPVKVENLEDHKMDPERYVISEAAASMINRAKSEKRRIIAVGTTAVRTLESACNADGKVNPGSAYTSLFVYPPYHFRVVDALLTNFHLPKSTLMALVSAFCEAAGGCIKGRDMLLGAYQQAVDKRYRFYSYGDCMLVK